MDHLSLFIYAVAGQMLSQNSPKKGIAKIKRWIDKLFLKSDIEKKQNA